MPPNLQDMEQTPKPAFLFQTKHEMYEHAVALSERTYVFKLSIAFIFKKGLVFFF